MGTAVSCKKYSQAAGTIYIVCSGYVKPYPFVSTPSPPTHLTLGCHISGRTEPPALAPQRASLQQLDSLLETLPLSVHGEEREEGRCGG